MIAATTTGSGSPRPDDCNSALSESQLEAAISAAMDRMCEAPDRSLKMQYWREMCRLIDQRKPARVRFLERMRGLA